MSIPPLSFSPKLIEYVQDEIDPISKIIIDTFNGFISSSSFNEALVFLNGLPYGEDYLKQLFTNCAFYNAMCSNDSESAVRIFTGSPPDIQNSLVTIVKDLGEELVAYGKKAPLLLNKPFSPTNVR